MSRRVVYDPQMHFYTCSKGKLRPLGFGSNLPTPPTNPAMILHTHIVKTIDVDPQVNRATSSPTFQGRQFSILYRTALIPYISIFVYSSIYSIRFLFCSVCQILQRCIVTICSAVPHRGSVFYRILNMDGVSVESRR